MEVSRSPSQKVSRWYFDKKELRQTPSILDGLNADTEARYRREGARFIIELGSYMNLSLTTMATGVVYYHRFYMYHTFQNFPRYPTACACLFLAGKVEETPKKCKDVIKSAQVVLDRLEKDKFSEQFGDDMRNQFEEVMTLERILLQTIKFDLQVEHPYTFLLKYAKCLKGDKSRLQKMVQMAWTFVNDSLCTTLCLQWEPEIIAIALMYLAGKLSKFEVVDWNARTPDHLRWWDMFVEDMSIELLEDICHQVLDLYSQTQNPAPSESPPPKLNAHSSNIPSHLQNQVSPPNQNSTPTIAGSSKTSTPVATNSTPTLSNAPLPPFGGPPPGSGQFGVGFPPPGMPALSFGAPPLPPPGSFSHKNTPPGLPPPPLPVAVPPPPGHAYYPPPPLPTIPRNYQPQPPPGPPPPPPN
ncbi:unnamed protein product [Allacma fusca]|uniref:Cyclin K n=1 Tax=Allacma fusca TaxID=39272 RepID=A0A8J2P1A9_9HEXA|nr:unnamed protein product [Allacma fusca]